LQNINNKRFLSKVLTIIQVVRKYLSDLNYLFSKSCITIACFQD